MVRKIEEFRQKVLEHYPKAQIDYEISEKRQQMVDSWPADTDDSMAKNDWNWAPAFNLDLGMKDYLVPDLQQMYKN